jgi:hypothetical protein
MIGKIAASAVLAVSAFGLVGTPALADPTPPPPPPSSDELAPLSPEARASLGSEAQAKLQAPSEAAASVPPCGTREPNIDPRNGDFTGSGVRIRTGPSTSCTAVGLGYVRQGADYYCYASGEGGTWTYLRDRATGKVGWVKDTFLSGYGSYVRCP